MDLQKIISPYLFRSKEWTSHLAPADVQKLETDGKIKVLKKGEVLFHQGTPPRFVVWLLAGKVKIMQETPGGRRQTLYIYTDGDFIGYRQLIAGEVHPVSAVLLENSRLVIIPAFTFNHLIEHSPGFSKNLLTTLARDFSVWTNRITIFTKYSVQHRLVLALLVLREQYRISGSPPGEITITRTELSEYVGASLETVVRAIHKLKAEGLVAISGRKISLPGAEKLVRFLDTEEE